MRSSPGGERAGTTRGATLATDSPHAPPAAGPAPGTSIAERPDRAAPTLPEIIYGKLKFPTLWEIVVSLLFWGEIDEHHHRYQKEDPESADGRPRDRPVPVLQGSVRAPIRSWVKVGWNEKYIYTFTWMGRPIIQLPTTCEDAGNHSTHKAGRHHRDRSGPRRVAGLLRQPVQGHGERTGGGDRYRDKGPQPGGDREPRAVPIHHLGRGELVDPAIVATGRGWSRRTKRSRYCSIRTIPGAMCSASWKPMRTW